MLLIITRTKIADAVRLPWSIATILTLSMVGIIAVLMIALTVVDIRRERAFTRNDQQERGALLVSGLSETLADHLYFNDVDALRDLAAMAVKSRTDIDYIQLWDVDGSLLVASSKGNLQKDYPTVLAAEKFGFENAQRGIGTQKFLGNRLQVTSPIFAGPNVVGIIQFGFNSDVMDAELRSILIQHIWQALALIAIGIVLSYLMARYTSKPLREIAASAVQIGQGNLDTPVPMHGARETADLGRSLANMRDDLRALYSDLETRVESRTRDLAEASEKLMIEISDRKAAEESLSHQNQELEILLNLAKILGRAGDYKEKCQEVLEDLARVTQADLVVLRILDEERQDLALVDAVGEISWERSLDLNSDVGLTASALQQMAPLVVNDYPANPSAAPEAVAQGIRSGVFLPIVSGESKYLGVVDVISLHPGHFDDERVRMLTAIADGLGVLLENARLTRDLEANREEMAAVDQVARIITSTLDIEEVYQQFASEVRTLVDFHQAALVTIDESKAVMTVSYLGSPTGSTFQQGQSYPIEDTYSSYVANTRETLIVSDLKQETRFRTTEQNVKEGLRSVIAVPLASQNKFIGALLLWNERPNAYGSRDQVILERLASQIAPAVENNILFQKVEQLALATATIGDGVCITDLEGNIQFVNGALERMLGYESGELIDSPISLFYPGGPDDPVLGEIMAGLLAGEWSGEAELQTKTGERVLTLETATAMQDDSGQIVGYVCVNTDITKRKRAEEALREAEERYRLIFENASDAIITFALDNTIISMNPEAEAMTGYSESELVGQRATVYLTPASAKLVEEAMGRWLVGEGPAGTIECEGVRKDGVIVPFEGRTQFIRDEEGRPVGYQGIFRDITERRAMEIRALAHSKLATLGEVATGVAHEINQPLTYIRSMIQSFQEDFRRNELDLEKWQARLAESSGQVSRITSIVDHLRTFGRRDDTEMMEVDLAAVLDSTLLLLGERMRLKNIELERLVDQDLPRVWGNASQLEQVYR